VAKVTDRIEPHVPVVEVATAQVLLEEWRLRGRIEHGYRSCQEAGLDVEDMRVRTLERMRRLFILVLLLAAQFVMHLTQKWPAVGVGGCGPWRQTRVADRPGWPLPSVARVERGLANGSHTHTLGCLSFPPRLVCLSCG
jgi:hypothetical protein